MAFTRSVGRLPNCNVIKSVASFVTDGRSVPPTWFIILVTILSYSAPEVEVCAELGIDAVRLNAVAVPNAITRILFLDIFRSSVTIDVPLIFQPHSIEF